MDPGDYNDDYSDHSPSLTDPSQDEPIEALVARMMRGEIVHSSQPVYDVAPGMSDAEAFAAQPMTERDGFDIADAPQILAAGEAAVKALGGVRKVDPVVNTPPAPAPAKPTAPEGADSTIK